jgi:hypothetical protein
MVSFKKIAPGMLAALILGFDLPAAASDPARTQETQPVPDAPAGVPEVLSDDPFLFSNEGQDFQILFPGGCGKVVTRFNEPDLFGGEQWDEIIQVNHVFCDRYQEEGEGCSVTATFNLHNEDGSMAGPQQVISRVEEMLGEFGATVVEQKALKKDFGEGVVVEGVEVWANDKSGPGQVWIRGLLVDGDIYILAAWNRQGGVWGNPDYVTFFNSFQPWVD